MNRVVEPVLSRWTRSSNRRRLFEEGLRAAVWTGVGSIVAVGITRLPLLWLELTGSVPTWSTGEATVVAAASVLGIASVGSFVRAIFRYRRRRLRVAALARRLDQEHETSDLLSTALAVEARTVQADPGLGSIVRDRAAAVLSTIGRAVDPFVEPSRALATLGVTAALVALMPHIVQPRQAAGARRDPEANAVLEIPPLSEETLAALEREARRLGALQHRKGLAPNVRDAMGRARDHLDAVRSDPSRSLSRLSRAEQELRALAQRARDQGLFSDDALSAMSEEELARELAEAIERRETDTAAAMAEEIAERLEDPDEARMQRMAEALDRAAKETPRGGSEGARSGADGTDPGHGARPGTSESPGASPEHGASGPTSSGREGGETGREGGETGRESGEASRAGSGRDWRERAGEMSEKLRMGDSGSARSEARKLAEEMRRRAGRDSLEGSIDRSLSEIRRARSEQLGKMNGEGEGGGRERDGEGSGGEGMGAGEGASGSEGAGPEGGPPGFAPFGPPSGKPGPGGGAGSDELGDDRSVPLASMHAPEWVDTPAAGAPQGRIRVIRRFLQGRPDDREYRDLHQEYAAIAESAVRREQIPLTRRDYIRNYFEAVRGD